MVMTNSQWIVEGVGITITGVAVLVLCSLGARSDRYLRGTAESILRFYSRPLTPEAVQSRMWYVRLVLILGIGFGVLILIIGAATIISGLRSKVLGS